MWKLIKKWLTVRDEHISISIRDDEHGVWESLKSAYRSDENFGDF